MRLDHVSSTPPAYDPAGLKAIIAALWRHRAPNSRIFLGSLPSNANKERADQLAAAGTPPNQLPPECRQAWRAFGPNDGKSALAMLSNDLASKNLYFKPARFYPMATRPLAMNVMEIGCAWIDIDLAKMALGPGIDWAAEVSNILAKSDLPPTLVVRSGGGLHAYWAFDRMVSARTPGGGLGLVQLINHELVRIFSGDPAVCHIASALRVPGTFNHNRGGVPVDIVLQDTGRVWDPHALYEEALNTHRLFPLDEGMARLPKDTRRLVLATERLAEDQSYDPATGVNRKSLDEWVEIIADLSREGSSNTSGGRNRALTVLCGKLFSMGHTIESALEFAKTKGCTLSEREMDTVVNSVARTRMRETQDIIYATNAERDLAVAQANNQPTRTAPVAEPYQGGASVSDPTHKTTQETKGDDDGLEERQPAGQPDGRPEPDQPGEPVPGPVVGEVFDRDVHAGAGPVRDDAAVVAGVSVPGQLMGDSTDAIVGNLMPTLDVRDAQASTMLGGLRARRNKTPAVYKPGPRYRREDIKPGVVGITQDADPTCPISALRIHLAGTEMGHPDDPDMVGMCVPGMMVPIGMASILNPGGAPVAAPKGKGKSSGGRAQNKAPSLVSALDLTVTAFQKWLGLFGMDVMFVEDNWWIYESATGVWAETDQHHVEGMIRSFVTDIAAKAATKSQVAEILAELKGRVAKITSPFSQPRTRNIIVCACGTVVDVDQDLEIQPDKEFYLTTADILAAKWDRTATCPNWDKAIRMIFDHAPVGELDGWVKLIQEWMSQVLVRHNRTRATSKALLLLGPKYTGKSRILDAVRVVIGDGRHTGADVGSLNGSFPAMDLIGKTAWLVDEIKAGTSLADDWLKRIVTNDPMSINRKFQDFWTGKLNLVIGFASNDLPDFNDRSQALLDRTFIVRCTTQFKEGDPRRDENMDKKIAAERDGLLQMMVEAAHDLLSRGRFDVPKSIQADIQSVGETQNDMAYFVAHGLTSQGHDCYVLHSVLRTAYLGFLLSRYGDQGAIVTKKDLSALHQEIQNLMPHTKSVPTSGRSDYRKLGVHASDAFISWFDQGWKADPKNNGQTSQAMLASINGKVA